MLAFSLGLYANIPALYHRVQRDIPEGIASGNRVLPGGAPQHLSFLKRRKFLFIQTSTQRGFIKGFEGQAPPHLRDGTTLGVRKNINRP